RPGRVPGEDHGRRDLLPQVGVGDADDGALPHPRILRQDVLDLHRVDVLPAADDQVGAAGGEPQPAVLDDADVAGAQPAVLVDGGGGGLRIVPVTDHVVGAAGADLALDALGDGLALG